MHCELMLWVQFPMILSYFDLKFPDYWFSWLTFSSSWCVVVGAQLNRKLCCVYMYMKFLIVMFISVALKLWTFGKTLGLEFVCCMLCRSVASRCEFFVWEFLLFGMVLMDELINIWQVPKPRIRFCQSCGGTTKQVIPDGEEKLRAVCSVCGKIHYENPKMVF